MDQGEAPLPTEPSTSAGAAAAQQKLSQQKRLKKLDKQRQKLKRKLRRLQEREIDWDNEAMEENAIALERKISELLLRLEEKIADLLDAGDEYKKLFKNNAEDVTFTGSGHAVLDERLTEALRQQIQSGGMSCAFLEPPLIAKIIGQLRKEQLDAAAAAAGGGGGGTSTTLPAKQTHAWEALITKIMIETKTLLFKLRCGSQQQDQEDLLTPEQIDHLRAENVQEQQPPSSLAAAKGTIEAQEDEHEQDGQEEGDDLDDKIGEEEDETGGEEEEDNDENEGGVAREAILAAFQEVGRGQQQDKPSDMEGDWESMDEDEEEDDDESDSDHAESYDPNLPWPVHRPLIPEDQLTSTDHNLPWPVHRPEDQLSASAATVPMPEEEAAVENGDVAAVSNLTTRDELEAVNISPDPPITPPDGPHNGMSSPLPAVLEEPKEEEILAGDTSLPRLKPDWLLGETSNELSSYYVTHKDKQQEQDDDCHVVFTSEQTGLEQIYNHIDPEKMERCQTWVDNMDLRQVELITLADDDDDEEEENQKPPPVPAPAPPRRVHSPGDDGAIPPKKRGTVEPKEEGELSTTSYCPVASTERPSEPEVIELD